MDGNANGGEQGAVDGQLPGCPCWDPGATSFCGGEEYLPPLSSSSGFIQLHPKALRKVQRVAGAEV